MYYVINWENLMSDEYFIPTILVNFNKNFKIIKIIEDKMIPVVLSFKADLSYVSEDDALQNDIEASISLAKMKLWVDNYLDGIIAFSVHNEWALSFLFDETGETITSTNFMMFPSELVTDDMLAQLLSKKLNSLGGNVISVNSVEVTSPDSFLSYIYTGEADFDLPEMEDWVGEFSYYDTPWWFRDDASAFDIFPSEEVDKSLNPLSNFDLSFVRNDFIKSNGLSSSVIRPAFKPTVINGGKDE